MFIWSGRGTLNSEHNILRDRCKYRVKESSKNRFPAPTLFTSKDGDSMARRFTSRLVPSHGDNVEDWVKNFPLLSTRRTTINDKKFRMYDRSGADLSFTHWIDFVMNEKSKKWKHGTSLCE